MKLLDLPIAELLAADVEVLGFEQGSPEWHAHRAVHFGASEAAAMLGLSPHETRPALLRRKHTGLQHEFSDYVQERVLDRGHEVEALARPIIEKEIGDDLSPVTCRRRGTRLTASCDGLTLMRDTAFECKQWSAVLSKAVAAGVVPEEHMPQCQQIMLVTGARRVIFTVSDGTREGTLFAEVRPDPVWFERILRGWAQFEADLAAYVPPADEPVVVAAPVETLPAVSVRMDGALAVQSNLPAFGAALRAFVERIPRRPETDQEFADCDAAAKALKRAEEALDGAEANALASISSVEEMRRTVATLRDLARQTRLATEKLVAARKEQLREQAVAAGVADVSRHIEMLSGLHAGYLTFHRSSAALEFGTAIKGLKTLDSIRAAVNARAAALKIDSTAQAERIALNLKAIAGAGPEAQPLFADRATLVLKDPEAVAAIVAQRLSEKRAADERALEAAERARQQAAQAIAAAAPSPTPAPASIAQPALFSQATGSLKPVRLADICGRLGWTLTAAEVRALGVMTTHEARTVLVAADQLPALRQALIARVEAAFTKLEPI